MPATAKAINTTSQKRPSQDQKFNLIAYSCAAVLSTKAEILWDVHRNPY
jgi:hypothetical protein